MQGLISINGGTTDREKKSTGVEPVSIDFTAWLAGLPKQPNSITVEQVDSVAWTANNGVTVSGQDLLSPVAYAQIEGGIVGGVSTVNATVTTSAGNVETFSYRVAIV